MTVSPPLSTFQRRLAEKRALEESIKPETPVVSSGTEIDADLIPDEPYDKTDVDRQLDTAVGTIGVLEAYARWCGKMTPKFSPGQTESIMISCPTPGHRDAHPSAWMNIDKGTWFCGTCQVGGDAHDIAAYHFGYPVPGYKTDSRFHLLRVEMARDFGYTFHSLPGGVTFLEAPVVDDDEPVAVISAVAPEVDNLDIPGGAPVAHPKATVQTIKQTVEDDDETQDGKLVQMFDDGDIAPIDYPSCNWRAIIPADSFIDKYMRATVIDDVPEEYHLWNSFLALGFALGRSARLFDLVPVYGNLFVCSLGESGSGKSKARYHLDRLLEQALPHDWIDPSSRGVRKVNAPASAEVLIHSFEKPICDPSTPKIIQYYAQVSGLIDFNELSALIGRANRVGNTIKPALMQFYDMEGVISTSSMSSGTKEAHEPFASALTTTQPAALRSLLGRSDDDSGFLNRWVFAAGPGKKRYAIGGALVDMEPAVGPLKKILGWSGSFADDEYIQWGPEASECFTKFFHSVLEPAKRNTSSALMTRIDLLMKKLILLFSANKMEKVVSLETAEAAISMYDYIKKCYAIPESQLGRTLNNEIADAIEYQAKKQFDINGKGVTLNLLNRALKRRNYPLELLLKTCDSMVKIGLLDVETTKPGQVGRPTTRYRYVG